MFKIVCSDDINFYTVYLRKWEEGSGFTYITEIDLIDPKDYSKGDAKWFYDDYDLDPGDEIIIEDSEGNVIEEYTQ